MKKSIFIILTGLLIFGILVGSASAMGGSGTQSNPYTISSQADLALLSGSGYSSYSGNTKYFVLTKNITISGTFESIGNSSYKFNGNFDGRNYTITGLNNSLFYQLNSYAKVQNLTFKNSTSPNILCTSASGLANEILINNIHVIGSVFTNPTITPNMSFMIGGLIGSRQSSYSQSGDFVISNCSVEDCYFYTSFDGISTFGGICSMAHAYGKAASISNCTVKNTIVRITNSAFAELGLIVGESFGYSSGRFTITGCVAENCYLMGNTYAIGGISGYFIDYTTFENCTVSKCTIETSNSSSNVNVGGIAGASNTKGEFNNCDVISCCIWGGCLVCGIQGIDTTGKIRAINNCDVINTNLYSAFGSSYCFDFSKTSYSGSGNTSSGITYNNIRIGLLSDATFTNNTSSSNPKRVDETVTFTFNDAYQGACVRFVNNEVIKGYSMSYGTGGSQVGSNPLTAKYSSGGNKTATIRLYCHTSSTLTISTTVYIKVPLTISSMSFNPSFGIYFPINKPLTISAATSGGTPTSYVWSYSTTPDPTTSSTWINIGTTSTNTTTFTPTAVGTYTFRVVASTSDDSADSLSVSLKPYRNVFVDLNGSGTEADPYQVGSAEDWSNWSTYYAYYSTMYMALTNDFTPTSTINTFHGNLDGNNHTLSNLDRPLFVWVYGTIKNLQISNSIILSAYGILASSANNNANISNVTIENCFIKYTNAAGIIGNANNAIFTNCTVNHTTIVATNTDGKAGGISYSGDVTVNNCRVLNCDILGATTYGVCA